MVLYQQVPHDAENETSPQQESGNKRRYIVPSNGTTRIYKLVVVVITLAAAITMKSLPKSTISMMASKNNNEVNKQVTGHSRIKNGVPGLHFKVSNEYTTEGSRTVGEGYHFLRDTIVVEPMRPTTLEAALDTGSDEIQHCSWNITSSRQEGAEGVYKRNNLMKSLGSVGHAEGAKVSVLFPMPYRYSVAMHCELSSGVVVSHSETVRSIYVRRELRELSDNDRRMFLDGMLLLTKVSTSEGQQHYGSNYKGMDDLVKLHLDAAGERDNDALHDGMGVLTQHLALTQVAELSLQSFSPSITMPYWDYTIESAKVIADHGSESDIFTNHELFSAKWFGSTADGNVIGSGRFQLQTIAQANRSISTTSPYGYLRAPWNLNPSQYLTRYHKMCGESLLAHYVPSDMTRTSFKWPTCRTHWRMAFDEEFNSWYNWVWHISYLPHGPVHSWIGGVGGDCDERYDKLADHGFSDVNITEAKLLSFAGIKNMWRHELMETPKFCTKDSADKCYFKCNYDDQEIFVEQFRVLVLSQVSNLEDVLTDKQVVDVADIMYCKAKLWPGDHLEAGSPADVSFWPIHPTLDRLYQYKQLMKPFDDTTWNGGDDDGTWTYCQYSNIGGCDGHHAEDLTTWDSILQEVDGSYVVKQRSNEEVRIAANPTGDDYKLPYIYNHFRWDHCNETSTSVYFPSVSSD